MMAQFLKLDPVSRDYVFKDGSPVESDDVLERAYYALSIPKNNWLYGATDQGSLLYTLEGVKRTGSIEQQYASYAEDAINQQLVANGFASRVGASNIEATTTGTSNQIEVVPAVMPVQSALDFVSV